MSKADPSETAPNENGHQEEAHAMEEFKRTVEVWEKKVLQLPVASNLYQ